MIIFIYEFVVWKRGPPPIPKRHIRWSVLVGRRSSICWPFYMCIYIYIYIYGEREREIYIYIEREREIYTKIDFELTKKIYLVRLLSVRPFG